MPGSIPRPGFTIASLREEEWFGPTLATPDGSSRGPNPGDPPGFHDRQLPSPQQLRDMLKGQQDITYEQIMNWFEEWWNSKNDSSDPSGKTVSDSVLDPSTIDYLNAELAKHYGMSRESAYQEALSNTAYQRAVKDMQAAGLNPASIFGGGRGSSANGVSYVSGGSGASRSGAKDVDRLFSSEAYNGISTIVGLMTALATKNPNNFSHASTVAKNLMQLADSVYSKG